MLSGRIIHENLHFCALASQSNDRVIVLPKHLPLNAHSTAYASFITEIIYLLQGDKQSLMAPKKLLIRSSEYAVARGFLEAGCKVSEMESAIFLDSNYIALFLPAEAVSNIGGPEDVKAAQRVLAEERLIPFISKIDSSRAICRADTGTPGLLEGKPKRSASFDANTTPRFEDSETLRLISSIASLCLRTERRSGKAVAEHPSAGGIYARRGIVVAFPGHHRKNIDTHPVKLTNISSTGIAAKVQEKSPVFQELFFTALRNQSVLSGCRHFFVPVFSLPDYCNVYGLRGYRFIHLECGALLQSLCQSMQSEGLRTRWIGGFDDHLLAHALDLDDSEVVSCLIGVK